MNVFATKHLLFMAKLICSTCHFCQEFLQSLSHVDSQKNFLKFVFSNTKCYSRKLFYQIA